MATVTPNYSWPVPTSTDLVKDGAVAIEALGDAIDATVFGLGSSGFSLINTTTYSTVASISVNNVFSSTYQNYRIVIAGSTSSAATGGNVTMRFRVSGSDDATGQYAFLGLTMGIGSGTLGTTGQTSAQVGYAGFNTSNSGWNSTIVDVFRPFEANWTHFLASSNGVSAPGVDAFLTLGGSMRVATSYTGFTLFFPVTSSGTIRVYGYKN